MTRGRTVLRCLAVWTAVLAGATFPAAVFGQPVPLVVVLPDEPRPGDPVTVAASGIPAGAFAVLYNAEGKRLARAKFFYYMSAFPVPSVEEDAPPPRPPVITTAAPPSVSPAVPFSSRTQAGPPATCFAAILTIPSTAPPGDMLVRVETASTTAAPPRPLAERFFRAADRTFTSEEVPLNQSNTDIRTKPDPEKTAQTNELWAILSHTGDTVYTGAGTFVSPVPEATRRTSLFGSRRVYIYTTGARDLSIHAGVDYGVPTGTPVYAPARGRVALSRFRISTGFSVILEHLPGVYSLYYHLNAVTAAEGSIIEAGTLIGQSGSSGLSTGPHLHWEVRVSSENTDPDALVSRPLLDKTLILSKLGLE